MSEHIAEPNAAELLNQAFNPVEEAQVVEAAPVETAVDNSSVSTATGHPAYQEILSQIPEMLHDKVRPTLEAWDKGVNEKLEKVHSQYQPYKPFVDNGVQADQLEAANRLYHALETDPKAFYEQLADFYKFGASGQGPESEVEPELDLGEYAPDNLAENPLFKAQQQQLAEMQATFTAQQEAKEQAEADKWLDSRQQEITEALKGKNIEPDWDYILNKAAMEAAQTNDYDKALNNATAAYEMLVVKQRTPVANTLAPPVLVPNGSVPASSFNANALEDGDRRKLMAQMLSDAFKD